MSSTITIPRPDDWHLHLRDGAMLRAVVPHSAQDFARAIIMPNLVPPVRTGADAAAYAERIQAAIPDGADFTPLMTLYLTETTDPDDVEAAFAAGVITALKLYPAGATTNSDAGVRNFANAHGVFERMEALGIPLLTHGEVTAPDIDIFDREARFIDDVLDPLRQRFPRLRVVMEHITTRDGADYVASAPEGLMGATITVQHLMLNRNHMLVGGVRPHYYCLPILKRSTHRGDQRQSALLSRHRQRSAPDTPQRERLRLRGGVLIAQCAGLPRTDFRRRRGAGPVRRLCQPARRGLLWSACQHKHAATRTR